jgi:O-antigen ligase
MKKADRIILYLFYLYVFMLPFENFMDELFGIKSPYRPHRILCLGIGLLILISRRFQSIRFNSNDLKLLGVYVFGLIPSLIAYFNNRLYEEYFWQTSLQYFIVLWILLLIKNIPFEWKHIHRCLSIYCFGVLINAIYMIYQFLYIYPGRQSGLMDNPNFAAFSCDLALVFFFYYFVRLPKPIYSYERVLCGMASFVLIFGLFITGSRSAILAMMIFIPFLLFYRVSLAKKIWHFLFLVLALILFSNTKIMESLPAWNRLTILFGKEDSRIVLWKQGFEAFKETNFMGLGIEQFKNPENYTKYIKKADNLNVINQKGLVVHNDFLTVLYEYGPFSFLLFISFYFTLFKRLKANSFAIKDYVIYYGLYFNMFWYSMSTSSFQTHSMWFVYIILGLIVYLPNAILTEPDSLIDH